MDNPPDDKPDKEPELKSDVRDVFDADSAEKVVEILHERICDLELLVATILRVGKFDDIELAKLDVMLAHKKVDTRGQDLRHGKGRS